MKTVSSQVLSTTPISLSKAASILSKFASAENGASQAISAYIRRASVAFCELTHLHKELKSSSKSSQRKLNRSKSDVTQENNPTWSIGSSEEPNQLDELNQGRIHGLGVKIGKTEDAVKMEIKDAKEKRKKRKSEGVQEGGEVGSEERRSKKKGRKSEFM